MNGSGGTSWERPDAPLGTLVYRAGLLSKEKLESALAEGRQSGRRLGEILLQKGWIEEKDLARLLAGQKGLAFVSLKGRGFDPEVARLLAERVSRFHCALAMEEEGGSVLVAIADPTDDAAVSDIGKELGRDFRLVVATASEIRKALDDVFAAAVTTPVPPAPAPLTIAPPSDPPGDFGLRVAPPPSLPAPAEPPTFVSDPEPVAAEPAPLREPETPREPEPQAEPEVGLLSSNGVADVSPAATVEPHDARVDVVEDPAPARDVPVIHEPAVSTTLEPVASPDPEPAPLLRLDEPSAPEFPLAEPTIERNEERHVSVAFHAPAVGSEPEAEHEREAEREPEHEPDPDSEPEPAAVSPAEPPPGEAPVVAVRPDASGAKDESDLPLPFRVVIVLDPDEEIEIDSYADEAAADAAARALIAGIEKRDEWPRVERRFIRPDRILSVDIRERQSWTGSRSRAAWGGYGDEPERAPAAGTSIF